MLFSLDFLMNIAVSAVGGISSDFKEILEATRLHTGVAAAPPLRPRQKSCAALTKSRITPESAHLRMHPSPPTCFIIC